MANLGKDETTVMDQLDELRNEFGIKEVIFVGDRGMITAHNLKKMKEKDTNSNFLSSGRCLPEVQTMLFRHGPKSTKFGTLNCPESGQISSYRGLSGTIRRRKMRSFF